jgi:hypothetical protein
MNNNNAPIGSPWQLLREGDLHFLVRAMAKKQALSEHMVINVRGNPWHLALSLVRKELEVEPPSRIRTLADFVVKGLHRNVPYGDAGSTRIEDLPMPWDEDLDVVLSWADSMRQLREEVRRIRVCLDTLGLFHADGQSRLRDLHVKHLFFGMGEVSMQLDRDKHRFSGRGSFRPGRILTWLRRAMPGLGKRGNGGKQDSWERFLAAFTALQPQSDWMVAPSSLLVSFEETLPRSYVDATTIQRMWETTVQPAQAFLSHAMAAIDRELRPAFSVHPAGKRHERTYDMALRAVRNGHFEDAIQLVQHIRSAGPVFGQAMGENYYRFAANVIMQAQVGWLEQDIERTLRDRFGRGLRRHTQSPTPLPANRPARPSPSGPHTADVFYIARADVSSKET